MIHYNKEWKPFFCELANVLKKNALFVFSTHQPHTEAKLFDIDNYYQKVLIKDYWKGVGEVQFYHHTIHELSEGLYEAGFLIERILEPKPLAEFQKADPDMYKNVSTKPWFLFVRAIKIR